MPKQVMTPWFPGKKKPTRIGVYEREAPTGVLCFSLWSGKHWKLLAMTKTRANHSFGESNHQALPWRGLASDPFKGRVAYRSK